MSSSHQNHEPHQSVEFADVLRWTNMARGHMLVPCPSICSWFDICGFRSKLDSANWSLSSLQNDGFIEVLSEAYRMTAMPIHVHPQGALEKILVLNDGVARSLDMGDSAETNPITFSFYLRDILNIFFRLCRYLKSKNLGLRTVLAGGERLQYSAEAITGQSILHFTGSPSSLGERFLKQQFVYHPREFQMNTAFSRAYHIDSMGSKSGFVRNSVYLESTWVSVIEKTLPGCVQLSGTSDNGHISFMFDGRLLLHLAYDKRIRESNFDVFRLSELVVHRGLDGEEVHWEVDDRD